MTHDGHHETKDRKTPSPTRRRILIGAGALTVAVAGGIVWRGIDRGAFTTASGPAYEPWDDWNSPDHEGTPLALVAAGILASNAHNTQPWIFDIADGHIDLYADLSRHLGSFDAYAREMHLSLGCALENMIQAAPANGFAATLEPAGGTLSADGARSGRNLVARLSLTPAEPREPPLYRAIATRHTNRGPYDRTKPLSPEALETLLVLGSSDTVRVFLFTEGPERDGFDRLTVEATEAIIADEEMSRDSDRWFRLTKEDVEKYRDGVTLDAAGLSPFIRTMAKLLPPLPPDQTHAQWLTSTRDIHLPTAALTGFIAVRDLYDIETALAAGRAWQRIHLWAEGEGIAMQPINQTVEIVDRQAQLGRPPVMAEALAALTGTDEWRPTFAFRAGYPAREVFPSPRRPLSAVTEDTMA